MDMLFPPLPMRLDSYQHLYGHFSIPRLSLRHFESRGSGFAVVMVLFPDTISPVSHREPQPLGTIRGSARREGNSQRFHPLRFEFDTRK